jgi:RHS repeat-associated protein
VEATPCSSNSHNWRYEYIVADHLGNARVSFADVNQDGAVQPDEVLQENHYYPFGMEMEGIWQNVGDPSNNYRYNGKELNEELGLYDYGARWYDPAVAKWTTVDPMADKMPTWSPYNYTFNNPIRFIDPDGTVPQTIVDGAGNVAYTKKGGYTKHATADIKRVGNAMMATPTGRAQWNSMSDASHNISITVSSESKVSTAADGSQTFTLGETENGRSINSETFEVTSVNSSDITIYEGSIEAFVEGANSNSSELRQSYAANTETIDQAIAGVAGHESVHATNSENHQQVVSNKFLGTDFDTEATPHQVESQILRETKNLNTKPLPTMPIQPVQQNPR